MRSPALALACARGRDGVRAAGRCRRTPAATGAIAVRRGRSAIAGGPATDAATGRDRRARSPTADANCGISPTTAGRLRPDRDPGGRWIDRSRSSAKWSQLHRGVRRRQITREQGPDRLGPVHVSRGRPGCGAGDGQPPRSTSRHARQREPRDRRTRRGAARDGSGTPTAAAIDDGAAYLRTLADRTPKFLMLVTDGAPTCAGTIGALSEDAAQAQADAVAAIAAALGRGVPDHRRRPRRTTAASDVDALNALAEAGGLPRTVPASIKFFTESTLPELFVPVESTAAASSRCRVRRPPPDASTVTFNGGNVPRDPSHMNGWDYTDAAHSRDRALRRSGATPLLSSRSFEVDVYYRLPGMSRLAERPRAAGRRDRRCGRCAAWRRRGRRRGGR